MSMAVHYQPLMQCPCGRVGCSDQWRRGKVLWVKIHGGVGKWEQVPEWWAVPYEEGFGPCGYRRFELITDFFYAVNFSPFYPPSAPQGHPLTYRWIAIGIQTNVPDVFWSDFAQEFDSHAQRSCRDPGDWGGINTPLYDPGDPRWPPTQLVDATIELRWGWPGRSPQ